MSLLNIGYNLFNVFQNWCFTFLLKNIRKNLFSYKYRVDYFCIVQWLQFPQYTFRFKNSENNVSIFDEIRKKFVILQPEEWVRQHCVQYLIQELNIPKSLINVEKELVINGLKKRYDIIVFYPNGTIFLIVECKAPKITINQTTFDQIAQYNMALNATYLMITNGLNHYYCEMDFKEKKYTFLEALPKLSY